MTRRLVFEDHFRDLSAWHTRQPFYTATSSRAMADPRCAKVKDGHLRLIVREGPESGTYRTGHIETNRVFEPYGRFEARLKFPMRPGALCAFWLQTTEDYIPGQAEIDIAESTGGSKRVWHNVYWREPGQGFQEFNHSKAYTLVDTRAEWHTYTLDWQPDGYIFYVDGVPTFVTNEGGLSNRPKTLILSTLVKDYNLDQISPPYPRMVADYVKVWQ